MGEMADALAEMAFDSDMDDDDFHDWHSSTCSEDPTRAVLWVVGRELRRTEKAVQVECYQQQADKSLIPIGTRFFPISQCTFSDIPNPMGFLVVTVPMWLVKKIPFLFLGNYANYIPTELDPSQDHTYNL